MSDEATRWFLEDAKAQGLSIREYEAKYGIMLMPAQRAVLGHETPFSDLDRQKDAPVSDGGGEELREAA